MAPAARARRPGREPAAPFGITGARTAIPPMPQTAASASTWLPATSTCSSSGFARPQHRSPADAFLVDPSLSSSAAASSRPVAANAACVQQVESTKTVSRANVPPISDASSEYRRGPAAPYTRGWSGPVLHRAGDRIAEPGQRLRAPIRVGVMAGDKLPAVGCIGEIRCTERSRCSSPPAPRSPPRAGRTAA